ncbi:dihydropteroate synthase [Oleiphilus sp. HI0009]|uniref:dihydropteroate synthase n=2 Tax=Oleiphilus TaxID=141450 RepID=UPI0007C3B192|nr:MULTISPECIES: dihydropteroate synthase [unclassified Oleiphilus]KZX80534.1 dihydropteroate synthase [Oleiphilus sp. HI0009]KZY67101.1 dihydropteroate synthase [Oleiphilus sp. HI0066]KZY73918.1 dihydropteroate synthase [Oleiphilus sp. HI0067]
MDFSTPKIMGILNVTPDSFSDGGKFSNLDLAISQALRMVEQGASIIDIGGESTRPGAVEVSLQEEMDRVLPVVEKLRAETDVAISLDTSSPELMREGAALGVWMINDVRAFQREGALEVVGESDVYVCAMHMQGKPISMQDSPEYGSVVDDVSQFLQGRVEALIGSGVQKEKIVLDPGFGFGKTLAHNLSLLKHLDQLQHLGSPLLVGISRKSMIGTVLDKDVDQRLIGSVAAALLSLERGASILRVHDVAETADALKIWQAMKLAK